MGKLVALKTEKKTEVEAPASVVAQGTSGKLVKTAATQQKAPFSTAQVGTERKQTSGTLGKGDFTGGRESAKMPTLGERVKNTLAGAGKQYGAGFINAAGVAAAGQGGNAMSEVSRRQAETLKQQIESLEKTLSEPDMTEQEREDTLEAIENAKRQRDIYSGAVRGGEETADAVYQLADEVANSGARDIEAAKRGAGKLGQLAVDVGVAGAQMGGDIAVGIATGGGALVPMFLRSAGGAAQEARQEGASHEQQVGYGLASGALSVATEKIANVAAPLRKVFGGGVLDKAIDAALAKMNGSAAGKFALSVLSEGGEEMLEDVVQPVLKSLYNGKSIGQNYDELTLSEVLYDGLIGGILGGVGGGVEVLGDRLARSGAQTAQEAPAAAPESAQERTEGARGEATLPTAENAPTVQETDALSDGKRVNLNDYIYGESVAPNEAYLTAKQAIPGAESAERTGEELPIWDMAEAQDENVSRETAARNMAQVRDAATALGKNGSRALTAAYNETAARSYAPQDAVRDFYQVYNAALNGGKDSNTTAPDYIRMAAQNAGERDARIATQAKYFGENAQLVRDENWKKAKLTSKQSYALDALAKVTGTEIRFADTVADGQANAEYANGVITLALDAKDPVMVSAVHETIHRIREAAPQQYQELAEFVRDNMSEAGMEYNLATRGRLYETDNIDLLTEETVADAFGRMLEDGKVLEQFTSEHRSAAQRIRDELHDLLLKIKRALGDKELRLSENQKAAFRDLQSKTQEMEELFTRALEATQNSKNAANEGGEATRRAKSGKPKYSFAGEHARTADIEQLEAAKELDQQGVDNETIREKTGWFKGMDGRWRFEIDDSAAEFRKHGDARLMEEPEYRRLQELTQKWAEHYEKDGEALTKTEEAEMEALQEQYSDRVWEEKYLLRDFLRHDALFEAYPRLKGVNLAFDSLNNGTNGYFDSRSNTIVLADNLIGSDKRTLLHEVQHIIQKYEGFARGSSPEYWRKNYDAGKQTSIDRIRGKIATLEKKLPAPNEKWTEAADGIVNEIEALEDRILEIENGALADGTELYRNTAGEIEARDTAARRDLTAEERKAYKPDLGDENTVFVEENGWNRSYNYDPETASVKEQIENSKEKLNAMDIVARAAVPTNLSSKDSAANWAIQQLRSSGYKVDKQGYGEIVFTKKDIDRGLRYADTPAEKAAIVVLPQVLKKGVEIGNHSNHKQRAKQTVTFAAPVELNGTRGNMAVVVNKNGNHYYAHRIVLPDGTVFKFSDVNKNTAQELSRGVTISGSLADTTSAVSSENVSQNSRDVKKRYSLKEYTPEEQKQHVKDAVSHFGKTYRWNETGYLTPNGTKLDFSGRHEGAPGGYRTVDHRDIRDALGDDYGGDDYSGSMVQFMSEGNIRISPESGGINLSVAPTKAQLDALSDFVSKNRGEVILDIDTTDGRTAASVEYPRGTHANKVLGDIKAYFEDGTMPQVSELAQFRYSLKEYPNAEMRDPEVIEPVNRVTDKGKYSYLANDFRENGYEGRPVVVYESPYGLQALTGSHRVLAAREAGIEIPTVLIENPEAIERLSAVNSDDELQSTARDLYEEGLIDESTRDLLAREEELNNENYDVPYEEQTRYSRSDREMLDEYITEYGEIPTGEKPHRTVRLPKRTEKNKYVSQTIRTVLEAKATPDVMLPTIESMVAKGDFSYERYTDEQAVSDAESKIKTQGWQKTLNQWKKSTKNEVSKEAMATGWALYNNAATSGDVETALDVLNDMVSKSRNAAQALQAVRLLKKQEPSAQLYGVQRSVETLQEEIKEEYGKNAPEIKVDRELAEKFLNAESDEARTKAMGELYRDIGRQMPSRFIDKWNAWRYLAMLGNPRTHVRNIVGNAGFMPMVAVKNAIGAGLEQAVNAATGGKAGRTKAILTTKDADIIKAAWGDYANVEEVALGEGKYSESAAAKKEIEEGRVIFKTKPLESFRKFNSAMLDKEDMWFSKPHYAAALAGYCKANGITAEQIASGKGMEKARNYAVREAQKATYRDTNAFSQMVSRMGRVNQGGKNGAEKVGSAILEGILPFRKTPANILVRGVEYSPIGMTKAISYDLYQVAKGNMEATEMLDHLSAGLTGTGVMALGAYMVFNGILGATLRGTGGGDEEEKDFDELRGHQDYSLELPNGKSITLDWLAPEVLPLFVGANLAEQMQEQRDGELTMADMLEEISNVSDPLLQMSCLQSLNDLFDSIGYAASSGEVSALANIVASAATSYLTQAVPTLFGQIERTGENVRMTTYTDKNQKRLTGDMQYAIGRASSRLPIGDYNQIPYIDAWGRTESTGNIAQRAGNNFLNPAYTSTVSNDAMEDELERLYDATNDAGVLPDRAARYFNVNGERKDLTGEEYVKYATAQGQTAYRIVSALTSSSGYRALDDSDKAAAVENAYKVAKANAKMQVSSYQPDGMAAKCIEAKNKYGIDEATFILLYQQQGGIKSLKDRNGKSIDLSEGLLKMEMVYQQSGLSDKQRAAIFKAFNVPESIRHYNKALVAEKLKAMRKKAK